MKRIITTIAALAFSAMIIQAADAPAAPAAPAAGEKKKPDPEAAWAKMSGGKESVTKEEFTAKAKDKAKAEALFDKKDANKDGKLTKEEFMAHGKKAK
ncbi:MAG: hypothetical protein ABIP85_20115 [Chthoniobacteraceae bacterium]